MKIKLKKIVYLIFIIFLGNQKLIWGYLNCNKLIIKKIYLSRLSRRTITISETAIIDKSTCFPHPQNIVIGRGVRIKKNCTIYQGVTLGVKNGKQNICDDSKLTDFYPLIEQDVIIYTNAVIVGNVTIGKGSTIGANVFLDKNTKENSVVVGYPAKVLK